MKEPQSISCGCLYWELSKISRKCNSLIMSCLCRIKIRFSLKTCFIPEYVLYKIMAKDFSFGEKAEIPNFR
jgi:hypothetical protein